MSRPSPKIEGSEQNTATETVSMPVSLLEKIVAAARAIEDFEDELEDYLLSQDDAFVARMRQARQHHVEGADRPLDALKHELCIEYRPHQSLTRMSQTSSASLPSALFARWSG